MTYTPRSLELESNEPLSLFRRTLSPGQLSRASGISSRGGTINMAVGAGIEPARDRLTICPVFQHTSPTRSGDGPARAAPCLHGRPPRASPHAVTPFSRLSEIAGTLAPWVPGASFEPTSSGSEPHVLPLDAPKIGPNQAQCVREESNLNRRCKKPLLDQ